MQSKETPLNVVRKGANNIDMTLTRETEAHWAQVVEDVFYSGLTEAILPIMSFGYEDAKAVARRVKARMEIRNGQYVFYKVHTRRDDRDEQEQKND